MIIPIDTLSPDVLTSIIQEFVLREGTDYGDIEKSLADKVSEIESQLKKGVLVIVYSELHETVNIMPAEQFNDN